MALNSAFQKGPTYLALHGFNSLFIPRTRCKTLVKRFLFACWRCTIFHSSSLCGVELANPPPPPALPSRRSTDSGILVSGGFSLFTLTCGAFCGVLEQGEGVGSSRLATRPCFSSTNNYLLLATMIEKNENGSHVNTILKENLNSAECTSIYLGYPLPLQMGSSLFRNTLYPTWMASIAEWVVHVFSRFISG